jgi:hypothetical protein
MRSTVRSIRVAERPMAIDSGDRSWLRHKVFTAVSSKWRRRERASYSPYVPFPLVPVLNPPLPSQTACLQSCLPTPHSASHRTSYTERVPGRVGTQACFPRRHGMPLTFRS